MRHINISITWKVRKKVLIRGLLWHQIVVYTLSIASFTFFLLHRHYLCTFVFHPSSHSFSQLIYPIALNPLLQQFSSIFSTMPNTYTYPYYKMCRLRLWQDHVTFLWTRSWSIHSPAPPSSTTTTLSPLQAHTNFSPLHPTSWPQSRPKAYARGRC